MEEYMLQVNYWRGPIDAPLAKYSWGRPPIPGPPRSTPLRVTFVDKVSDACDKGASYCPLTPVANHHERKLLTVMHLCVHYRDAHG